MASDDTKTRWTLLDQLRGSSIDDARARAAMEELAARYRPAVKALVMRFGRFQLDADDVTQRFFEIVVLRRKLFARADRKVGRFRNYLTSAVHKFVIDELRNQKRDANAVRPDGDPRGWDGVVVMTTTDPVDDLVRDWVRNLIVLAIKELKIVCKNRNQEEHFQLFAERFLSGRDNFPGWSEVGQPFQLDEKLARSRAKTAIDHFQRILKEMIANDPGCAPDVNAEIRDLIARLSTSRRPVPTSDVSA